MTAEKARIDLADPMRDVLADVAIERGRQDARWGQQNHRDGTGQPWQVVAADEAREACERAFREGWGTWAHILQEEFREALAESDPDRLRTELVQVAAVASAWAEAIDRRVSNPPVQEDR